MVKKQQNPGLFYHKFTKGKTKADNKVKIIKKTEQVGLFGYLCRYRKI